MSPGILLGLRHFGILCVGFFFAAVFLEVTERLAGQTPDPTSLQRGRYRLSSNPLLGYEPIPSMSNEKKIVPLMDYNETANSLGYRDREHTRDSGNIPRIIVLGDSVTAGQFVVRKEDVFPLLLETKLADLGTAVDVMNFGVTGYNTQQEIESLRKNGLAYNPDIVILAYCLNDRVRSDGGLLQTLLHAAKSQGTLWYRTNTLIDHSRLFQRFSFRYLGKGRISKEYQPLFTDTVEEYFREFSQLAKEHGFIPLVAVLPDFRDQKKSPLPKEYQTVLSLAKKYQLEGLELLSGVKKCSQRSRVKLNIDHYHPTKFGHQCLASTLVPKVSELLERKNSR